MEKISTNRAPAAIGPYSQAVKTENMIFLSGQIPIDPETGALVNGGIRAQTEQICKNIGAVLHEAGADFGNVIKTTCFLSDMADFSEFNEIYAEYFVSLPARSCVAVKGLPKNALCEIEVIAEIV